MDEGAGCLGSVFGLLLLLWVPLHFSGKSILYGRTEVQTKGLYGNSYGVKCLYFTSTGTEEINRFFDYATSREAFYCPRTKDIGQ